MSHPLHLQALEVAQRFKQAEADLVDIFQKIEKAKVFSKLGYASLFEYGVKALGLSESNTYAFIQVSRKSLEVPALKEAVRSGAITVSKAKRIVSVITPENQSDWITKAESLSKNMLEREVARENPKEATRESSRYVSEDRLELKTGVSESFMKKLKRVQDLESQRTRKAASFKVALEEALEAYLEKNDPVRKAERARPRLCPGTVNRPGRSRIPSITRHALNIRDQGRCTHVNSDGSRCDQARWVEVHHIKPVSEGGSNSIANLTTLCFNHHRFEHQGAG